MWSDLKFTFRAIRRQPGFALMVLLTLSLGIGGSVAIFTVVNAVLLRDLPYPDAKQIYLMRTMTPDGAPTGNLTPRDVASFVQNEQHPLVQAAAIAWSQQVNIVGADGKPYSTTRYGVTDKFFEVFGSRMALGRAFERGQNPGPLVISYATWRDLFGSDPDIIGKTVNAEGIPRPVVGVTREDFEFPEKPGYLYLMRLGASYENVRSYRAENRSRPGDVGFQLSHRLVDELEIVGVVEDVKYLALAEPAEPSIYLSSEQWIHRRRGIVVRAAVDNPASLVAAVRREIESMDRQLTTDVSLYPDTLRASLARERLGMTLLVIFGIMAAALAAVGIYGVMSYSVTQRTGEIAVRSAMGASTPQLMRLFLGQGAVLAFAGVVLGLLTAVAVRRIVASQLYGIAALDARVFVVAPLALLGVAALASFVPARRATKLDPADLLRIG